MNSNMNISSKANKSINQSIKKSLFVCAVTLGFLSVIKPVFADTATSGDDAQLQKVMAQTNKMESQMRMLKAEIRELKAQQRNLKRTEQRQVIQQKTISYSRQNPVNSFHYSSQHKTGIDSDMAYIAGSPIVIASYVGEHTAFDASDLIINYSSYNESLHLLQLKQKAYKKLNCGTNGRNLPFLMVSGKVEGLATYQKPSNNVSNSSINLEDAELDIAPVINEWASGFIGFQYGFTTEPNVPPKVVNTTRVHINKAFLTFGNLDRFPVYMTMGQINVPFGQYATPMISNTLNEDIFQTRAQAVLLGYAHAQNTGLYGQLFAFNGDTRTNRTNSINNLGADIGYQISNPAWSFNYGAGVISNIADSFGMQQTYAPIGAFGGFSTGPGEKIQHQVGGVDLHASFSTGPFSLISEYTRATTEFNPQDMTFNGRGAEPQALDLEGSYSFHIMNKPSAVSLGYGKSWESLALVIPEYQYTAAFTTSVWKDTIEELEFKHTTNYNSTDSASGLGIVTPSSMKGFSANTVTAQLGIYF